VLQLIAEQLDDDRKSQLNLGQASRGVFSALDYTRRKVLKPLIEADEKRQKVCEALADHSLPIRRFKSVDEARQALSSLVKALGLPVRSNSSSDLLALLKEVKTVGQHPSAQKDGQLAILTTVKAALEAGVELLPRHAVKIVRLMAELPGELRAGRHSPNWQACLTEGAKKMFKAAFTVEDGGVFDNVIYHVGTVGTAAASGIVGMVPGTLGLAIRDGRRERKSSNVAVAVAIRALEKLRPDDAMPIDKLCTMVSTAPSRDGKSLAKLVHTISMAGSPEDGAKARLAFEERFKRPA